MRLPRILKALIFVSLGVMMGSGISLEAADMKRMEPQKHLQQETLRIKEDAAESEWMSELARLNPDWQAWLEFDSGLISLPVVQGKDNSWYLDHLFDGSPGVSGTLFFDTQCRMDDPVRVIYGHSVFFDPSLMFTPLHCLKKQSAYEENRYFTLMGPDSCSRYRIIAVCVMDENSPTAAAVRTRCFAGAQLQKSWLEEVMAYSLIESGYMPSGSENVLVLQTCEEQDSARRLYVFAVCDS